MKLTDANKIIYYVKEQINPYGKPFDGSAYEFGLKLIKYLENLSTDYDIDNVVEELESDKRHTFDGCINKRYAIEIVKQGGVGKEVD